MGTETNILDDLSEVTEVWYKAGNFKVSKKDKFLKAPFNIITLPANLGSTTIIETYVMPTTISGDITNGAGLLAGDTNDNEMRLGRGSMGYSNLNPIVIDENEMGDLSDNWKGLHSFGLI